MSDLVQQYNLLRQVVSTTANVNSGATYTSTTFSVSNISRITGTVFADQAGTWFVDQSSDNGAHWDMVSQANTVASTGAALSVEAVAPLARIRWTNTSGSNTTVMRLYGFTRNL